MTEYDYNYNDLGYYDDYGNWVEYEERHGSSHFANPSIPKGNQHDSEGRLIDTRKHAENVSGPEDIDVFLSTFTRPFLSPEFDGTYASKLIWGDIPFVVKLVKVCVYECSTPKSHQATTDEKLSRELRANPKWQPILTLFVLNKPTYITKELLIETAGPPRRDRFKLVGKTNSRDLTQWVEKERVFVFATSERINGAVPFYADFCDTPDRYFISNKLECEPGVRRMNRFGAYPATQYYVMEKTVVHDVLEAEGGSGLTYWMEKGNKCFAKKGWKLHNSFLAFDEQIPGSNLYTVYRSLQPFDRMLIVLGPIDKPQDWIYFCHFFAFDVAIPGSCSLEVHHCIRSIYSTASSVPRHRLTSSDRRLPWEFRFQIYVMPIYAEDCLITQDDPTQYHGL